MIIFCIAPNQSLSLPNKNKQTLKLKHFKMSNMIQFENECPELNEQGQQEAQDLMNKFEKDLKQAALKIMEECSNTFYSDILSSIESDHWTNYRTKILNSICNYNGIRTYEAARIRKAIYQEYKEEINKHLNQDLLRRIAHLEKLLSNPL